MKKNLIEKIAVTLIAALLMSGTIFGQPKGKPPRLPDSEKIEIMVNKLASEISLSQDQKSEILNLYESHFNELKEKKEQAKEDKKLEREKMDQHREAFKEEVKSLLSEEQQDKIDEFMEDNRPKRGKRSRH